jgi:hypothetical protein
MWIGQGWRCKQLEISKGNEKNRNAGLEPLRFLLNVESSRY